MAICNNKSCSLGECDQPETCAAYVPVLTRSDKIRAMSDEDLAAVLRIFCIGMSDCEDCPIYGCGCPRSSTFNDWIKWLQQPVEEVDHEDRIG